MIAQMFVIAFWLGLAALLYLGVRARQKPFESKLYPLLSVLLVCAVLALLVVLRFTAGPNPSSAAEDPRCTGSDCAPERPEQL
jgi:hypothetical protein